MKNTLLIILFLLSTNQIIACRCVTRNITERIAQSDFVATAKIVKVTPNVIDTIYDNVEIEIIEIYKGKRTTKIKTMSYGSCGFSVSENSIWLIFATKDTNENLSFGYCSGAKQIDKNFNSIKYPNVKENHEKGFKSTLDFLSFVKEKKITITNDYNIYASISPSNYMNFRNSTYKILNTKSLIRPILFELTISKNLSIKKVDILQDLKDRKLRKSLIKYLKLHSRIVQREKLKTIPQKTKIIYQL